MIKPYRPLLLLLYVAILLGVIGFFLPSEIHLGSLATVRLFSIQSIFENNTPQYADISAIKDQFDVDTTQVIKQVNQVKPTKQDTVNKKYRIQYFTEADTALHEFFRSLHSLSTTNSNQLIRVLHYGDSQIEGDRITSYLRGKLQERFGGCGVGLVPLVDALGNRISIVQHADPQWQKIRVYGPDYTKAADNRYGVIGSYFRYSYTVRAEGQADSLTVNASDTLPRPTTYYTKKWQNVSVDLLQSKAATARESRVEQVRLLYSNPGTAFELSILTPKDTIDKVKIDRDSTHLYRSFRYAVTEPFKEIRLTFGSSKSPDFYALALDCNRGVACDNIPFRGSSGIEFTRMNRVLLQQQYRDLDVKFIILQFGVNVVPHVIEDYTYYEALFYNQLKLLKSIAPQVSILVVGVSDMSRKEGTEYISYPNIEKIRDAQRNAAFKAGCAFFDLYEAMGGKNSMPSWVMANPALANKDFTHFTAKGASLVSEMLYKALLSEYEKFSRL